MIKQRVNRVYHIGILYFYMYIKDKESDKMISIRKKLLKFLNMKCIIFNLVKFEQIDYLIM